MFYDVRPMSLLLLESMRVLACGDDGILQIRPDDLADQMDFVVVPEPQRLLRHRPAP